MPSPPKPPRGKRAKLQDWLAGHQPKVVGEAELEAIRAHLGTVSSGYLRKLLRSMDIELAPAVEGVRQENFDVLERTLLALLHEYEAGDPHRKAAIRRLVIEAKDHARFAARKPEKRVEKDEMKLWMLTWLENPPLFPQWVALRKEALKMEHSEDETARS